MNSTQKPTSAKELRRRRQPFSFEVNPNLTVMIRRADMQTLIMEGLVPLNLLDASERFQKLGDKIQTGEDPMKETKPEDMADMVEFMRRYAIAMVVSPKLTLEDDGREDSVPVSMLTADELMAIFNATPPGEETEAPKVTAEVAREFRGPTKPNDVAAPQAGESVRSTAKLVDTPEAERISA